MKKLLLLSATALVAFSCGQKNKAHISGTFSGISKDTIYLEMLTTKGRTVVDSTVTNQQGNYRFTVSTPLFVLKPTDLRHVSVSCIITYAAARVA